MKGKVNTITPAHIKDLMDRSEKFVQKMGDKTLVVVLTLPSGFEIVGKGSCVDPVNFDEKQGTEIALREIENKLWELEGYRLQCELDV